MSAAMGGTLTAHRSAHSWPSSSVLARSMRNDFRRSRATPFSFSLSRTRPSPKNASDGRRERKSEKGNDFISFIRSGQLNVRDVLAGQWPMNECKSFGRFPHSLCCRLKPRECCDRKRPSLLFLLFLYIPGSVHKFLFLLYEIPDPGN